MATNTCESCGNQFYQGVGRPSRQCPDCRAKGLTLPPKRKTGTYNVPAVYPRPVTSHPVTVDPAPVATLPEDAPEPVNHENVDGAQALANAIADIARQSINRAEVDNMLDDAMHSVLVTVNSVVTDALGTVDEKINQAITVASDDLVARVTGLLSSMAPRQVEVTAIDGTIRTIEMAHNLLPVVIQILGAGLHIFLVGPAGSGKSTLVEQAAEAMGVDFGSMSVGPTTQNVKLFGYMNAVGDYVTTPFRKVYEFGGIFLLDEMDNGHPGLLAELNQALANGYCAFADGMVKKHDGFRMVATGNTFGKGADRKFVGRNTLDAATLDRFATVECPIDEMLENRIAGQWAQPGNRVMEWIDHVQAVRARVESLNLPIVVSPRSTIEGAKLLASGMEWSQVADIRLFAGIDAATRRNLEGR